MAKHSQAPLLRHLLDVLRPTLDDVARWVGASRSAVEAWRLGYWNPPAAKRAKLVTALRKHAKNLLTLTDALAEVGGEAAAARPRGGGVGGSAPGRGRGVRQTVRGTGPRRVRRKGAGR